jgi:hypothetical protein
MGQYGGIVGGVVGAVVGSFVPGLGTQAGWMIGSALGGAYSASRQVIPGPKIGEVATQTAMEGGSRPIIFARSQPIAGNVICDGGPRIVTRRERQGKGGPKVESESAYRTYAVGVCEGPIKAFLQVWRNQILVYDAEDPAMAAENADFLRYARFYLGTFDQMPSPDLEAVKGAGNVSAHRGTAYMVLKDEDVTDQRGMWSNWTFRVSTTATVGVPTDLQLGAEGADYGVFSLEPSSYLTINSEGNPLAIWGTSTDTWIPVYPGDSLILRTYNGDFSEFEQTTYGIVGERPGWPEGVMFSGINESGWGVGINGWGLPFGLYLNGRFVSELVPTSGAPEDWWVDTAGPYEFGGLVWFIGGRVYVGFRNAGNPGVDLNRIYCWPLASAGGGRITALASTPMLSGDDSGPRFWMHVSAQGKVRALNTDLVMSRFDSNLVFEQTETVPAALEDEDIVQINGFGVDDLLDMQAFCYSTNTEQFLHLFRRSTGEEIHRYSLSEDTLLDPVTRIMFTSGRIYIQRRQEFYFVNISVVDGQMLLSEVVEAICDRVNMGSPLCDTSDLTDLVRGFTITNQYPAYSALQSLSHVFFFDPSNVSGVTRFVKRGGNSVATITEADMLDDGDNRIEELRKDSLTIPRVLHLNYYDITGGLNTDKQMSERPEEPRAVGEQALQTPVILSADEAATVVATNHGAMAEAQKGELKFTLPDNRLRLTESDPIIVQWEGKSVRGVIAEVETDDGEQRYKVQRDRQSLWTTQVEGIPAAPVSRPPSRIAGPTLLQVLDTPILRDADDQLGFYVAVSGVREAWQGAFVEASLDGGETWEDGERVTGSSVIGTLSAPLGDHPQAFPDAHNVATVQVQTPRALLSQTTLAGMMNRRNLAAIGNELVNFADVDESAPGVWELSHLLRGRKGTQAQAHDPGTRFVLLDRAIFVPADLVLLNRTITFRATSFGRPVDEATVVTITFTGQSQRERRPAYLQAYRDGDEAVISWQGVGRLGGGVHVAMGQHFAGFEVEMTQPGISVGATTMAENIALPITSFSSDPITVTVRQRNNLTGLGPAIEVTI